MGFLYWDDEDVGNANDFGGVMPDGEYDKDTRMYYCCRSAIVMHVCLKRNINTCSKVIIIVDVVTMQCSRFITCHKMSVIYLFP